LKDFSTADGNADDNVLATLAATPVTTQWQRHNNAPATETM